MAWGKGYRTKKNKFGVAPKAQRTLDGVTYASKLEKTHAVKLRLLQRSGEISDLQEQVPFPLIVNDTLICHYIADFIYTDKDGKEVIHETKGVLTTEAKLKYKLFEALYGKKITLVYAKAKRSRK
jgi:hypothetical protein